MSEVQRYYDANARREWERLEHHRMELAVTLRALDGHLPRPPARVLDVGGGPGRYAIELAARGYTVTLADLSEACLEVAREMAAERGVGLEGYVRADARDLGMFPDGAYDAVLLMGPLYHLVTEEDRSRAVREARRALRPGGTAFAAFIGRYAPIRDWALRWPERIAEGRARWEELLETGVYDPSSEGFTWAYFARSQEVRPLMERHGFETVELLSCEGALSMIEDGVNRLTGEEWEAWVDLNYRLARDPGLHAAAEHLLYVGRKA